MVVNKPEILIYVRDPDEDLLSEICAGIEEEGVLYRIVRQEGSLDELAAQAAGESMLGSGIGMTGHRAAMAMAGLPPGRNVSELDHPTFLQCRRLGANSARAVKRMPFLELYGTEDHDKRIK